MEFLKQVRLVQGGMGAYVSNWRLARAVAVERPGVAVGTVSGTALDVIYTRLLQLGDPGGHVRRALKALDVEFGGVTGQRICDRYFIDGGKAPNARFRSSPMHIVRAHVAAAVEPALVAAPAPISLKLDDDLVELLIATTFAEVWLAKEGHNGKIFINFLNKIELPLIFMMYGAMLAGVDGVVVGAGNPDGLAMIRSQLANQEKATFSLSVLYREASEDFTISLDPERIADGIFSRRLLKKPAFLAIASLEGLAEALAGSESEAPDGFIIEHHTAGGHNANPLGPQRRDALGQPIYSERDNADMEAIRKIGQPFWLAGGYGSSKKLQEALAAGATGVQAGSIFALAEESGMKPELRSSILAKLRSGTDDASLVRTTMFSPTGFSFKVVQLENSLSEDEVFENRRRVCDLGVLQQLGLEKVGEDGSRNLFQRCAAGPIDSYITRRGIERNTQERRCLCNGLLSCVGLGQVREVNGIATEEPAIVTLGSSLDGVRRLSRQGQVHYWARDAVADILGEQAQS